MGYAFNVSRFWNAKLYKALGYIVGWWEKIWLFEFRLCKCCHFCKGSNSEWGFRLDNGVFIKPAWTGTRCARDASESLGIKILIFGRSWAVKSWNVRTISSICRMIFYILTNLISKF